jgi:hypothetical protein
LNHTERRKNPSNIDAQVIFQYVVVNRIEQKDASWWYHYQFIFYCFYGNAHRDLVGKPILKTDYDPIKNDNVTLKLKSVQQRLNYYLRYGVDIINGFNIRSLSYGILGISVTDPKRSDIAFVDGPPTLPPTPPPSYDTDPSIISNGTKSPRGTDGIDSDDGDDDENDSMSPPSVTVNDGASNNQSNSGTDPGNNIDGSYSEWITYTSPVNVQLWVRCV